jgi:hypothetical protein
LVSNAQDVEGRNAPTVIGVPVIEVLSLFLYRCRFSHNENTFDTNEEPEYLVELKGVADVGVLQSKKWFHWYDRTSLFFICPLADISLATPLHRFLPSWLGSNMDMTDASESRCCSRLPFGGSCVAKFTLD